MNDDSTEKRMAGDYEIIQAVQIGDREVVLGENPQDETGMKYARLPGRIENPHGRQLSGRTG